MEETPGPMTDPPSTAAGSPAGQPEASAAQPEGGSPPGLPDAVAGQSSEPELKPEPSASRLLGLPDQLPETWCPNCKADVKPKGKGQCPRCGRVLKQSFLGRRHPVNVLRRDQILNNLVAEYQPTTTVLRAKCEHLAGILEQLEALKPRGSQEYKRLLESSEALGSALEASRVPQAPPPPSEYDSMTEDEQLEHTQARIDRVQQMIDLLRHNRAAEEADGFYVPDDAEPAATPAPQAAAPEPPCDYCHQAPCVGRDHQAFSALHFNDPVEVERREKAATDEMLAALERQRKGGDPWVR